MFRINGKVYRNLEEQVLRNQELSEENADKIAALEAGGGGGGGSSLLVESSEYPGCYYIIMPDGLPSWLNPPMILGEEYRTIEYADNGKAVYTKSIEADTAGSDISAPPGLVINYNAGDSKIVRGAAKLIRENGTGYLIPATEETSAEMIALCEYHDTYFNCWNYAYGNQQDIVRITVWYTKG